MYLLFRLFQQKKDNFLVSKLTCACFMMKSILRCFHISREINTHKKNNTIQRIFVAISSLSVWYTSPLAYMVYICQKRTHYCQSCKPSINGTERKLYQVVDLSHYQAASMLANYLIITQSCFHCTRNFSNISQCCLTCLYILSFHCCSFGIHLLSVMDSFKKRRQPPKIS